MPPVPERGRDKAECSESPAAAVARLDDRRLGLIRAAYEIIAAEGFERLRTRDIASRVGVNVATLHYYFSTKAALIEGVALYLAAQFQTAGAPGSSQPSDAPLARLRQQFADSRYYLTERPEMIEVMRELNLRASRDPLIAGIIERMKGFWRAKIEDIVATGIREGIFNPDRRPHEAAAAVTSMLWGAATFLIDAGEREHVYAAIEEWLRSRT